MAKNRIFLAFVAACSLLTISAEGRRFLPPTMGWSSWNTFAAEISDSIIRGQADAMIDKGFAAVGYNYINIDDGFFANRDSVTGRLIIHPTRFPDGLRPVVDYIHSKGLKAGTYSDAGHNTCASYWGTEKGGIGAGLYEHDQQDISMYFDEMDFDFIKVDFCGGNSHDNCEGLDLDPRERYTAIRQAINNVNKKGIVYNLCRWNFPGTWAAEISDSWRTTQDIEANWPSISSIIDQNLYLSAYCADGHYNDLDMLEIGRGMTSDEDVTHFAIWCMMSSPLLIGCDMRYVSDEAKDLMTNPEMIAVNQDPLGLHAYVAGKSNGAYILVKDIEELDGNARALAIYNPTTKPVTATVRFADLDLAGNVALRDLYRKRDLGTFNGTYTVTLQPHATQMLRASADERLMRKLYEAETAYLTKYQELVNNEVAGTAIYSPNASASGEMVVSWLGNSADNDLQWRNVMVPETGDYYLTISYFTPKSRQMALSVNDGAAVTLDCPATGGKSATKTVRVRLNKGLNKVRIANPDGFTPDVDYMIVER